MQLLWALVLVVVGVVAARHRRHLRREIVVVDDLRLHVFRLRLAVAVAVAAAAVAAAIIVLGDRLRRALEPAAAAAAGASLGARAERGELMAQLLELLLQRLYWRGSGW